MERKRFPTRVSKRSIHRDVCVRYAYLGQTSWNKNVGIMGSRFRTGGDNGEGEWKQAGVRQIGSPARPRVCLPVHPCGIDFEQCVSKGPVFITPVFETTFVIPCRIMPPPSHLYRIVLMASYSPTPFPPTHCRTRMAHIIPQCGHLSTPPLPQKLFPNLQLKILPTYSKLHLPAPPGSPARGVQAPDR